MSGYKLHNILILENPLFVSVASDNLLPPDTVSYPGEYDGASLLLELLEEALVYVLERGFTFSEVYVFVCLYVCSLELICNTTQTSGTFRNA